MGNILCLTQPLKVNDLDRWEGDENADLTS